MKQPAVKRLGILLSGRGSNFLAIAEAIETGSLAGAEIAIVISNVAEAEGLQKARSKGLSTALYVSKGRKRAEHAVEVYRLERDRLIADLLDDNARAADVADILALTPKAVHDAAERARASD